jgi:hypothetical protein
MSARLTVALWLLTATLVASAQQLSHNGTDEFDVTGKVVNSITGQVVHSAFVQLASVARRTEAQHMETGSDGDFSFHHLAPGKYNLIGQARGFPTQSFDQHDNFNSAIVVGPNKVSTGIVFRLQPEGSISGRVLDEHHEAVREAQVWLFERRNDIGRRLIAPRSQMQSDDLGEYHFSHLGPGTYYLAVAGQPWYRRYLQASSRRMADGQPQADVDPALDVAYPLTYYPGATDADSAGAIALHSGDRVTADFDLVPVQSLHFMMRIPPGDNGQPPMPNFRQRVFGEPVVFIQPNVVGTQGQIEISGIAPGDYTINLFRREGNNTATQTEDLILQQSGELDTSAALTLEKIHGVVKFEGSRVPPNPFIQLNDVNSGRSLGARIDEHGEFSMQPEQPGRLVLALGNAPGYAIRNITATGTRVSGRTVEFTGTQPVELSIEAFQGVGTVNGSVMNGDKPISGAMVVLVPRDIADNLSLFRRDQSDSDGTFTLPDVVPGLYTAIAIQDRWDMDWAQPEALRPYLAKGTPVQIDSKQQLEIRVAAQ